MPSTKKPSVESHAEDHEEPIEELLDSQTVALRIIAALLVVGAAYLLASLLVPFVLALVLTIALSPIASWLEHRAGFSRILAALSCMLAVALAFAVIFGLILYQAGTILQNTDKYLNDFGKLLAGISQETGGQQLMASLGVIKESNLASRDRQSDVTDRFPGSRPEASGGASGNPSAASSRDRPSSSRGGEFYSDFLRRNVHTAGRWLFAGLGGLLGFLGGFVIFLAYIFYMLSTREVWMTRIRRSSRHLGLQVRSQHLHHLRHLMVTYIGYLALVSLCYVVVITFALWMIGLPQPLLWGVLTGLLEVIPYFGPILAATMPMIVALSLGTWWQPAAVLILFVALQTIEGYVIAPMLYGSAVQINPVTIIFGLLFFGWLWGPLGLTTAMPMMILLRGFITMTTDTPALHALVGSNPEQEPATSGASG